MYKVVAGRILDSLADRCTTSEHPEAEGLLLHGASFVKRGQSDNMLPSAPALYVSPEQREVLEAGPAATSSRTARFSAPASSCWQRMESPTK